MYKPTAYLYEEKSKHRNRSSLILIINLPGGKKKKSALNLYCSTVPKNILEKKDREAKFLLASQIVNEKERELLRGVFDVPEQYNTMYDFMDFAKNHVEKLKGVLVESRKYTAALGKFIEFLVLDKYPFYSKGQLPCIYLTEALLKRWILWMEGHLRGQTPRGYLSRMKILIRAATSELYFKKDPSANLSARQIGNITKAVLTIDEIKKLWLTPLPEHEEVRTAFLFACSAGLRFSDVNNLQWANIINNTLILTQKKTSNELTLPLKSETMELLGKRGRPEEKIFSLQSHTSVNKWIKIWAKTAGINKKVTFHVARHSLATNLVASDVNLVVVSKILGHASVKQTQHYVRVSETLKEEALNKFSFHTDSNK